MIPTQIPSLLAPAGNKRAFLTAVRFGADAVYCGFKQHSLRAKASNFGADELAELIAFAHARGVKVHLTLNSFMSEGEENGMLEDARTADEIGADYYAREAMDTVRYADRVFEVL